VVFFDFLLFDSLLLREDPKSLLTIAIKVKKQQQKLKIPSNENFELLPISR
jgi:hypothetical protein